MTNLTPDELGALADLERDEAARHAPFRKGRGPNCRCTFAFTCGACLDAAVDRDHREQADG